MAFIVLNRVGLRDEMRPSQIKETDITIQEQSPFSQFSRTLEGDWRTENENKVVDAVLEQVFKDTFSGKFESQKISDLQNAMRDSKELNEGIQKKVTQLEETLTKETEKVNTIVETIIHAEDLTQAQKALIFAQHPSWRTEQHYNPGDIIKYKGELYEVIQDHVSQGDWSPDDTPALYTPVRSTEYEDEDGNAVEVINDFVQPTGGHDVYNTGDKVRFNGAVYESTMDNNNWSPTDYPQGWKLLE